MQYGRKEIDIFLNEKKLDYFIYLSTANESGIQNYNSVIRYMY